MYTFELKCKKYVKHYLEHNYGKPCYITGYDPIGKYLFYLLDNSCTRHDKQISFNAYTEKVVIEIKEDIFYRKGYELSNTNVVAFNKFVEDHIKTQIRIMMDALVEFGGAKIPQAIECVYDKFDMDETILPFDTIKKDYQRYRARTESLLVKR